MPEEFPDWIKRLIEIARAKGHVTFEDVNTALPPDQATSEQIEEGMAILAALEISIVDESADNGPVGREEAYARGVRRLEMATAALRHGRAQHACTLMETTIAEIKSLERR